MTYLLSNSLRLPPPIIRIRIKHKHVTICECNVEHVSKEKENYNGRPLQPGGASGSHVMRRKCDEGEEEYEGDFDSVAGGCDGHVFIVGCGGEVLDGEGFDVLALEIDVAAVG
mmetsp:Transcript_81/g.170  ORF Transcript_81/g.170 Transcript_81/m.170 type:complete len:113 (-) Transcript_81:69-407(-)